MSTGGKRRICPRCESEIAFDVAICRFCGADAPPDYAGPWRRLFAYMIDKTIIVTIEGAILFFLLSSTVFTLGESISLPFIAGINRGLITLASILALTLGFVGAWLYFACFESSPLRATPGKLWTGIQVTDLDGQRITFGRASARFAIKLATLGTGALAVLFSEKKQALYDMLASTIVLRRTR